MARPVVVVGAVAVLLMLRTLMLPNTRVPDLPTVIEVAREGDVVVLNCTSGGRGINLTHDPPIPTFYDDPTLSYSIDEPMTNWNEKRAEWLRHHPSFIPGAPHGVLMVTGSQLSPCKNPIGDHLLLRAFKNKVDYCRIHGYDIFYNNALFHPKMTYYWTKLPLLRAAMIAHPEVEWIFWVDSDAVFTDMEFKLPLEKYKKYNMVLEGWPVNLYKKKSWLGVNAGVFLMRNCQWSMDFINVWASMGPTSPNYEKWGQIIASTLSGKMEPVSCDQSALVYLLLKERNTWGKKIYIEKTYELSGYWVLIVDTLKKVDYKYTESEKKENEFMRRHAESVTEHYAKVRETHVKKDLMRRPFITHFVGCQPCSGDHNPIYTGESCWKGMEKTLNFADNQVLRNFGFTRAGLKDTSPLKPSSYVS